MWTVFCKLRFIYKKMKRRSFIKGIISAGIVVQFPLYISCSTNEIDKIIENEVFNSKQKILLLFFLNKLFSEQKNIPSVFELNTYYHINKFLLDKNVDQDEKNYLIKGIKWAAETSFEEFNLNFDELDKQQKNKLFDLIVKTNWGESWMSSLLTLVFESLLLDDIYNVNKNQIGWKWLHHLPGNPRPTKENDYKHLLERKKTTQIITNLSQL